MVILVTGGAGFIGTHLCMALHVQGHGVYALDNFSTSVRPSGQPWDILEANVEDLNYTSAMFALARTKIDRIYHLACPASPVHYQADPVKTMRTAFIGTMNVFNLALEHEARVLIASTSEVYGDPSVHPQPEGYFGNVNPLGPRACYDEGKRAAESLAWSYASKHGLDVRIARIFNTYGPGMNRDDGRLIPNFTSRAMRGEDLEVYGDGLQTRSLCYVDDMVSALALLMESGMVNSAEPMNLGNPDERTVLDIANHVASMFEPRPRVVHRGPLADDPRQRLPDIFKARTLLRWEPTVHYEVGVRKTVEWFRLNGGMA